MHAHKPCFGKLQSLLQFHWWTLLDVLVLAHCADVVVSMMEGWVFFHIGEVASVLYHGFPSETPVGINTTSPEVCRAAMAVKHDWLVHFFHILKYSSPGGISV